MKTLLPLGKKKARRKTDTAPDSPDALGSGGADMQPRHFLNLSDAGADTLLEMIRTGLVWKKARHDLPKGAVDASARLMGRSLLMIFEKASTRTRISFEMAMRQLGGSATVLDAGSMQLGRGETVEDTARVISRYSDAIMIRANSHDDVAALAGSASIPVINGLTDRSHPCQIVADLMTLAEEFGGADALPSLQLAWVGDGNNVAASLIEAAGLLGFRLSLACPEAYRPGQDALAMGGDRVSLCTHPGDAVRGADAIFTDTWVSMGDKDEAERKAALAPYQVTEALMQASGKARTCFLHCLPAHRGEEVTDSVIDGPASRVFDAAENRLHAQKAVLAWCFDALYDAGNPDGPLS